MEHHNQQPAGSPPAAAGAAAAPRAAACSWEGQCSRVPHHRGLPTAGRGGGAQPAQVWAGEVWGREGC
eukprot:322956-Chlamydomonas_euryale.AAC.1